VCVCLHSGVRYVSDEHSYCAVACQHCAHLGGPSLVEFYYVQMDCC
jgi:hypothetical protein